MAKLEANVTTAQVTIYVSRGTLIRFWLARPLLAALRALGFVVKVG